MLHVLHEGIDTRQVAPNPQACLRIAGKDIELSANDEVVTYVARNLEPYRAFPSFMRSLPTILARLLPAASIRRNLAAVNGGGIWRREVGTE
jgi:hypothetical protein